MKTNSPKGPSVPFENALAREPDGCDTWLDLDNAPLIIENFPRVRARIRQDLKAICDSISGISPRAAVLLTGSLSVGEGRCREGNQPELLESDYDLVVITPSFMNALPAVAGKKLKPLFSEMRFLAPLEITLIWKPMLVLGMTTTAGRIIRGNDCPAAMLENLPAPRAAGALESAYCHLASIPMSTAGAATHLSKALVNAARAFFLQRYSTAPRTKWVGLSSIRVIRDRVEECKIFFQGDEISLLRQAADHLLRKNRFVWAPDHYPLAKTLLFRVHRLMARPFSKRQLIKRTTWAFNNRGGGRGLISGRADPVPALQSLTEAWGLADAPERPLLMEAAREVGRVFAGFAPVNENDAKALYGGLLRVLQRYVSFFPNKLYYPTLNHPALF